MVDVHSFALPGFVSQATFALTLALLAWSDARTRGTRWLEDLLQDIRYALRTLRQLPPGKPGRGDLVAFGDPYFNKDQQAEAGGGAGEKEASLDSDL